MPNDQETTEVEKKKFSDYLARKTIIAASNVNARNIVDGQIGFWRHLIEIIQSSLNRENIQIEDENYSRNFFAAVNNSLMMVSYNIVVDQGIVKVIADAPIIEKLDMELQIIVTKDPWYCLAVVIDSLAKVVWSQMGVNNNPEIQMDILSDPRLTRAQSRMYVGENNSQQNEAMVAMIKANANIGEAKLGVENLIQNAKIELKANKEAFDNFVEFARSDIEAAKRSFGERLIIEDGYELWQNKARGHGYRFGFGLSLFAICIGGAIWWISRYAGVFLDGLPKKTPDGEHTYISILIVALCAIGFGWLLRFIAKYTSDNLALGADAAQRKVMVQTYLALVADKDAKMEAADRSMMLHAAFRPLPGQQSDDIPAPTVVEMIQKAVAGKP